MTTPNDAPISGSPAEIYQKHLVPAMFGPWADAFVAFLEPAPGISALDVGCGTGALAERLSDRVGSEGRVVGLDYDEGMIATARAVHGEIDWYVGAAQDLPFRDGVFELVACHQGLQFFPSREESLGEMRRVMRPGGQLGLAVWRSSELSPGQHALGQALGKWVRPELAVLPPFLLSDADELSALVRDAGFDDISVAPIKKTALFSSVARFIELVVGGASAKTREALAQLAVENRDAFNRDVEDMLSPYVTNEGVALPMEAHFLSARSPS